MQGLALEIWKKKYRAEGDETFSDTAHRVAITMDTDDKEDWRYFEDMIFEKRFISGGRITAGAGTKNNYLLNCAVIDVEDSIENIYDAVKRAAVLAKCNYGVGLNFSKIRPKNTKISKGGIASGPVSFMKVFDASGSVIETGGGRRAAQIAVLNVSHPDIFEFIDAKRETGVLTQFNISVGITQAFLDAVKNDTLWRLTFKDEVYDTVPAKELWEKLCRSAYDYNDPGILFLDEINKYNNGWYLYDLNAVNPCGELPLPPNGVCCLGNINLTKYVKKPFDAISPSENFNWELYYEDIRMGVRFLDNVLDVSEYPYEEMATYVRNDRRIGLNPWAGLGSMLAMLKLPYDSQEARDFVEGLSRDAMIVSYSASIDLAKEKGPFPNFDKEKYLDGNFIKKLPESVRDGIAKHGIRNIALLTIPPVGTGSLIAGNISNGLEPIFSLEYNRNVRQTDGSNKVEPVEDYAWKLWKEDRPLDLFGDVPEFFKTARQIDPKDHVRMQALLQKYIDGSISKTANIPESYSFDDYVDLLMFAINSGCKGFTTFREGTREGVLVEKNESKENKVQNVSKETVEANKLKRPRKLDGVVYQINETDGNHTYCTMAHLEVNGKKLPWEMFMASSGDNAEWYAIIGRLASRLMRKTEDVQGVIDELKSIGGEHGYFTPEYGYVKSKPQHLGYILEEYVSELNPDTISSEPLTHSMCPECGQNAFLKEGGCAHCLECGFSKCG